MLTDILLDLLAWSMIVMSLAGAVYIMYRAYRMEQTTHRRREWQRMPETEIRPNVRRVL